LRNQALQDITAGGLPGVDGLLQRAVLRVLAYAMAGLAYLHYAYQDWISRQAVPWTATDEWLSAWGALKGVLQKDATAASGQLTFSGTVGTDIPPGTSISRSDGVAYTSTADAVIGSGGTATVSITATVAGSAGNASSGTTFVLASPILGVLATGTAAGPITGGADQETTAAFRSRVLQAWANPPQGGAASDYLEWALAVPGVTRAWVSPVADGAGTVVVYFMMDQAEAAHGGFPQGTNGVASSETRDVPATGDQLAVANYIYPLRPVTALVYAVAPAAQPLNFTINNLSPNTTAIQQGISAALADMLVALGSPGGTLYPSDIEGAIASVPGIGHFTLASPSAPVTASTGALYTLGTITYSS
jgi:uncharacterized phage protein gp47/JayE